MIKSSIEKIVDKSLCLGCGMCVSIYGQKNAKMQILDSGFMTPIILTPQSEKEKIIEQICPGVNIINDKPFDSNERIWGKVLESYTGFSTDSSVRKKGSSGGIISAVCIYLLETKMVDAVLQIGWQRDDYKQNRLKVSKSKEDVLACAASRYAPAAVFNNILSILRNSNDRFCFVGKPCDLSALRNFLKIYPQYTERFVLLVSIVCAGMPSYNATRDAIDSFGKIKNPVSNLVYRGNGWPGFFSFDDGAGMRHKMTYKDSWGKMLGRKIHFRCKICPDGIGLQADMVVGDAWETKDGYPDFEEREGQSLLLLRTVKAVELVCSMRSENHIELKPLLVSKIQNIQPPQYLRRQVVGARIIAASLGKGVILNFRNMKIWTNLFRFSLIKALKEFWGTLNRLNTK
jgi:coenzyme F420 hydrogenase subunit beta